MFSLKDIVWCFSFFIDSDIFICYILGSNGGVLMKKMNIIVVYNKNKDKILMCKREKNPYKGLYN